MSDADDNEETLKDSASVTEVTKPPKVPKRPKRRKAQRSRLPSPPLVVQQLMEMGFSRRVIEKALNQLGDETIRPEMVVQWLLDHPDIEVSIQ